MPRLKAKLVEQRWHYLLLALLLQRVITLSRSRRARHTSRAELLRPPKTEESADNGNISTIRGRETTSPTSAPGAELSGADRTRIGLLALAVAVSAGIHIGLTPEHLDEMPRLGYLFIAAAVLGMAIALALVWRPDNRRIAVLAGFFCLGQIVAWVLFVTSRVPFIPETPEPVETIALVSKAVETVGWVLALGVLGAGDVASRKRATSA